MSSLDIDIDVDPNVLEGLLSLRNIDRAFSDEPELKLPELLPELELPEFLPELTMEDLDLVSLEHSEDENSSEEQEQESLADFDWQYPNHRAFALKFGMVVPEELGQRNRYIRSAENWRRVVRTELDWTDFSKWRVEKACFTNSEVKKSRCALYASYLRCSVPTKTGGKMNVFVNHKLISTHASLANQKKLDKQLAVLSLDYDFVLKLRHCKK